MAQHTNSLAGLPEQIDSYEVDASIRKDLIALTNEAFKFEYLRSVLTNVPLKKDVSGDVILPYPIEPIPDDSRIASAMVLLGYWGDTNAIPLLVSYITYESHVVRSNHSSWANPAIDALVAIGEPAVPSLLQVFSETNSTRLLMTSVSLKLIKRWDYWSFEAAP